MGRIADSRWFALGDVGCALTSGVIWHVWPKAGWWPVLIAISPWLIRGATGRFPFKRSKLDLAVLVFFLTAIAGVWAAYDRVDALAKFRTISAAILIYYALAGQPRANLWPVAGLLGTLAATISLIFLLGNNWQPQQADLKILNRIWTWWTSNVPALSLFPIHANVAGGILATLLPFPLALLWHAGRGRRAGLLLLAVPILGITGIGLLFSSSRGAWLALLMALAIWSFLAASRHLGWRSMPASKLAVAVVCLAILAPLVFTRTSTMENLAGIANSLPGNPSGMSRLELARTTLDLVEDFSMTGGGLGAFAGLYSHYILDIPFFYFSYSHNLFLDVALEQGVAGLLALLGIFLGSAWLSLNGSSATHKDSSSRLLGEAVLAGIIVICLHGAIDDAFYGYLGTPLLFVLPGIAVAKHAAGSTEGNRQGVDRIFLEGGTDAAGKQWKPGLLVAIPFLFVSVLIFKDSIGARWYASLGAVEMAKVELAGFPANQWYDGSTSLAFDDSEAHFLRALEFEADNRTARHRLGMIAMTRRDYAGAVNHLEIAYQNDQDHRGIRKLLGYSYVWSGERQKALPLLVQMPEAKSEMRVYSWWWGAQGREDLAEQAAAMLALLEEVH